MANGRLMAGKASSHIEERKEAIITMVSIIEPEAQYCD
jgi:hypothetical protein